MMERSNGNAVHSAGMSCTTLPPRLLLPEGSCGVDVVGDGTHDGAGGSSPSSSSSSSSSPSSSDGHSSLSSSSPSLSSQSSPQSTSASPTSPPNAAFMSCLPSACPSPAAPVTTDVTSSPFSPPMQTLQPMSGAKSGSGSEIPSGSSEPRSQESSAAAPLPLPSQPPSCGPSMTEAVAETAPFAALSEALQKKTQLDKNDRSGQTALSTRARVLSGVTGKTSKTACAFGKKKEVKKTAPEGLRGDNINRFSTTSSVIASQDEVPSDSFSVPAFSDAELTTFSERLDGGHARLCDSLAAELAQQIEMIVEDTPCLLDSLSGLHKNSSGNGRTAASSPPTVPLELEIEGRLGVLIDLDTSSRLRLPLTSLALLSSSFCSASTGDAGGAQTNPGLRFDAGVNQQQFSSVRDFMHAVCGKKGSSASGAANCVGAANARGPMRTQSQEEEKGSARGGRHLRGQPFASVAEAEDGVLDDWASLVDDEEYSRDKESSSSASSSVTSGGASVSNGRRERGAAGSAANKGKEEDGSPDTWIPLPIQMTEEEYHQFPGLLGETRIRVSYPSQQQSSASGLRLPTGAIWKENQMTWNLYSGQDSDQEWAEGDAKRAADLDVDECENRRRKVDCRVALNIEHHPNLKDIMKELDRKSKHAGFGQNQQAPVVCRMRKRQSFMHPCGVRVDLTEVTMKIGGGGGNRAAGRPGREKVLYEVEVELNPTLVLQAVKYKQLTGDSLPLLALCVSFLAVLEDLSVHLNLAFSASDASKGAGGAAESSGAWSAGNGLAPTGRPSEQRFADLTRSFPPAACVARFKEYLSPCLPLVGDYGFRAVAPELQRRDEKKLTEYLANTNVDEESLYTNDTVTIMGPWVPCLNEEGRIEFAVPVAARLRGGA